MYKRYLKYNIQMVFNRSFFQFLVKGTMSPNKHGKSATICTKLIHLALTSWYATFPDAVILQPSQVDELHIMTSFPYVYWDLLYSKKAMLKQYTVNQIMMKEIRYAMIFPPHMGANIVQGGTKMCPLCTQIVILRPFLAYTYSLPLLDTKFFLFFF